MKSEEEKTSEEKRAQQSIHDILHNYRQQEESMVKQLYLAHKHGPTVGSFREDIWRGMFEQMLPKKFAIAQSVFIIDSYGGVSKEVDLAIFDETYTPYIFRVGRLKFLPIEAVAVVVECKSTSPEEDTLTKWAERITALQTSNLARFRTITKISVDEELPTQTATRPLRILCCLKEFTNEKFTEINELFDMVICASNKTQNNHLKIIVDSNKKNLEDWYLALNHANYGKKGMEKAEPMALKAEWRETIRKITLDDYKVSDDKGDISLLTLNLQLNQILMLVNNPMPFPHQAYAEMFNHRAKEGEA